MRLLLLLLALAGTASAYKFLSYNPMFGRSHSNFIGKISDALIEAGHEVVMLVPLVDTRGGTVGTKKARVIKIDQCDAAKELEKKYEEKDGFISNIWKSQSMITLILSAGNMTNAWVDQCDKTLGEPGLLEALKAEKFDAAYAETMDPCSAIIFHLLGIEKHAVTLSWATFEAGFEITGAPTVPSYIPGMAAYYSDQMSFLDRFANTFSLVFTKLYLPHFYGKFAPMIERRFPQGLPSIMDIQASASLVFLNSEPLIDFPKTTVHKIVDIGGITVSGQHKPLNETWDAILSLRPQTVLISFGTIARSFLMPDEYKNTIRETVRKFPNVTFIWKYEKPEHDIANGVENLLPITWAPQTDLLYDPRLSLFITHCGAGSTTEATVAGVPLIVLPIMGDQRRNAQIVKRLGTGLILDKEQLGVPGDLEEALKEVLSNPSYRTAAERTAAMIADRPFSMRETFVRNMEFMVEFGPLRNLDHYGRHLSFIQYYLLDVFAFLSSIAFVVLAIVFFVLKFAVKLLLRCFSVTKAKKD